MEITFAYLSDYEEILAIQKLAFQQVTDLHKKDSIVPICQTLTELVDECTSKIVLKGISENKLIGTIRAVQKNHECHISKLIVLPQYQGKGYDKKLLLEIEKYFPKVVNFVLETDAQNTNNKDLYKEEGYRIIDKKTTHDDIETIIMSKFNNGNQHMTILDEINANKRLEVEAQKQKVSIKELKTYPLYSKPCLSLKEHLLSSDKSGIIAEHKRQSPSKGIINGSVNLKEVVTGYEKAGASAVSVLTDSKYFGGTLNDLKEATSLLSIPILRKDFIIDEYQIHEAKAYGASIILLIAASLSKDEVDQFAKLAHKLGMEVLFEIHNEEELKKISEHVDVVGVNNRNLKTFTVDINQSVELFDKIPDRFIKISESGISDPKTVSNLKVQGFQGFLMGENFMKEENPGKACLQFTLKMFVI